MNRLAIENAFGEQLLDHNGLMTPVLTRFFGPIYAYETQREEDELSYRRTSTLFQSTSQKKILDAHLVIAKGSLPVELIEDLRVTSILFGQLLKDHNIDIETSAPKVRLIGQRWGRSVELIEKRSGKVICSVEELLVKDKMLLKMSILPQKARIYD